MITHKTFSWVNRWDHMLYKNIIIRWCLHLSSYVHSYQTTTNNMHSRGYLSHNVNHGLSSNEFYIKQHKIHTLWLLACFFIIGLSTWCTYRHCGSYWWTSHLSVIYCEISGSRLIRTHAKLYRRDSNRFFAIRK